MAFALMGLSALALLFGGLAHQVPWRLAVMVAGPLAQLALARRALKRGIDGVDCVRMTWLGAGLLVAYAAWVLLRLPGVNA
jgi:hypothetical protein